MLQQGAQELHVLLELLAPPRAVRQHAQVLAPCRADGTEKGGTAARSRRVNVHPLHNIKININICI